MKLWKRWTVAKRMRVLQKVMSDPKLSLAAKGMFGYMMAYPKKWSKGIIAENSATSPRAVHAAFRELVKAGHITVTSANEPPS